MVIHKKLKEEGGEEDEWVADLFRAPGKANQKKHKYLSIKNGKNH